MDTQNIRQRVKDDDNSETATTEDTNMKNKPRDKRIAMAKRGMRSLAIAVTIPMSLTFLDVYFFGYSKGYGNVSAPKPAILGLLPLWILHMSCLGSSLLMGLSAWLVWAEGGFHRKPTALSLYLAQLGFSLAWSPIVFRLGIPWVGLMVCLALFGSLVGCSRQFKEINPVAGDLVKPCLAWVAFLAIVNLKLVFF